MEPIAVQQNTRPVPARGGSMLPGTAGAGVRQFLTFILGGVMYALEIVNIKEIIEYGEVTEVPMMPPSIRGIINLRGAVVPVIDLAARFGGQPASVQRRTCIVIVEAIQTGQQSDIGIMVDAVSEVLDIAGSEIEPPPPSAPASVPISLPAWAGSLENSSSSSISPAYSRSKTWPP